jgi:hypothetical protein
MRPRQASSWAACRLSEPNRWHFNLESGFAFWDVMSTTATDAVRAAERQRGVECLLVAALLVGGDRGNRVGSDPPWGRDAPGV